MNDGAGWLDLFNRRPRRLDVADHAGPAAWATMALCHLCWLIGANGWLSLVAATRRSSRYADPVSGRTYLLNSHGSFFWITPQQFWFYDVTTNVSLVSVLLSVIILLVFVKGPTVRYMLRKYAYYAAPILLFMTSVWFWSSR